MTTPSGASSADDYWRRPADHPADPSGPDASPPPGPTTGGYAGPPPTVAPPAGWRPPLHLQPAAPRRLPAQDMVELDTDEQRAQRITYMVGSVAGAVLLILLCLFCTRLLF
ncbi:hypothetical protein [Micromonospora sp. SH-82]|uniref:hypothetical protein n=1 Tax=Micromonospora sp. SH-82 TaxID=3132938 RepID=UPI003EBAFA2E